MITYRYTFAYDGDCYVLQTCGWHDPYAPFMELLIDIADGHMICNDLQTAYADGQTMITTWQLYTIGLQQQVVWMWAPSWYTIDGYELNVMLDAHTFFSLIDGIVPLLKNSTTICVEVDDAGIVAIEVFDNEIGS